MRKIISIIVVICLMATIGVTAASANSVNGGTTTITYREPDESHFKAGNYTGTSEFTVELRENV